jgi:ABC-type oligopeptide transport system substrate-binding subunit
MSFSKTSLAIASLVVLAAGRPAFANTAQTTDNNSSSKENVNIKQDNITHSKNFITYNTTRQTRGNTADPVAQVLDQLNTVTRSCCSCVGRDVSQRPPASLRGR